MMEAMMTMMMTGIIRWMGVGKVGKGANQYTRGDVLVTNTKYLQHTQSCKNVNTVLSFFISLIAPHSPLLQHPLGLHLRLELLRPRPPRQLVVAPLPRPHLATSKSPPPGALHLIGNI